jgi:glutamate-1-semialdehyde 2,1-aminomutase
LIYLSLCLQSVDETFATLDPKTHKVRARVGNLGFAIDPASTTKVVEFNDLAALEAALKDRSVACVLAEPVMTNIGIIHPQAGYWEKAQKLIRDAGSLLIIDETHTICAGPGGYTREHQLKPDLFVIGKRTQNDEAETTNTLIFFSLILSFFLSAAIGSGIPCAAYGFSADVARLIQQKTDVDTIDTSGIGGTLTANALAMAAMRATLQRLLTDEHFAKTVPLAERFTEGVQKVIDEHRLPWSVTRLGCRAEYW